MTEHLSAGSYLHARLPIIRGLRVLQVIDADPFTYPPTVNAARALGLSGAQVMCLGGVRLDRPRLEMPGGVNVYYEQHGAWYGRGVSKARWALGRIQFRRAVRARARSFDPHLVIAYEQGAAWASLDLLHDRHCKVVLHIHDNASREQQSWRSVRALQWRAVMRAAGAFDARVVPEQERAEALRSEWNVLADIDVVANAPLRTHHTRNSILRHKLGIPDDHPIAIAVGNIGLLAETTAALARTRANWHLVTVGETDKRALESAKFRAGQLDLTQRLHVLPYTAYDSSCAWLRGCDVGLALYPSTNPNINWRSAGTASVKLMEYLCAGLPVITTQQASLDRLSTETNALKVLPSESPDAIAHVLDELEPSGPQWEGMSQAARRAHETRFHMEAQLRPLLRKLDLLQGS